MDLLDSTWHIVGTGEPPSVVQERSPSTGLGTLHKLKQYC